MHRILFLLLISSFCQGMIPAEAPKHRQKKMGGFTFSAHVQDQMVSREISIISILNALSKGVYCKESDHIDLCIYKPEELTVVVADRKVIVTAWRNKSLDACKKKIRLMVDLQGKAFTASEFKKFKAIKFKWASECIERMKKRHMTQNLVRDVLHRGTAYPTYSGSKLFVRYPYAALYKDGTINSVFAGIDENKVKNWIKQRNLVMSKNCPSYKSNHQVTTKSIRKHINKMNVHLLGSSDDDSGYDNQDNE